MECVDEMKKQFEEMPRLLQSLKSLYMPISWAVTSLQVRLINQEASNKTRVVAGKDFGIDMVQMPAAIRL